MDNLTPAMQQYQRIKQQHKDCILMFRMGDFYEMFYEDAKIASKELEITLTKRGVRDNAVPLAGVPYHAVDQYIAKFVKKGYKLAICEQMEDPKLAKGVVKRDVIRIITPGTVIDEVSLDSRSNNYLMAIYCYGSDYGLAVVDISTGEFLAMNAHGDEELSTHISLYSPSEILIPTSLRVNAELTKRLEASAFLNNVEDFRFKPAEALHVLVEHFGVQSMSGFGLEDELAICASGALLSYLKETQKRSLSFINRIIYLYPKTHMVLDESTLKNLELIRSISDGSKAGTLISVLDKTKTPMGSRLISRWLKQPLLEVEKINHRLDAVQELINKTIVRKDVHELLKKVRDIERLISRVSYGNCNAVDLVGLKESVRAIPHIKRELSRCSSKMIASISTMNELSDVFSLIDSAIKDQPAAIIGEGNMIKNGFNSELDRLHDIKLSGKTFIAELEQKEREKTGIKSLKVSFNRVFGYYIEVTKSNLALVPQDYIRKQTLVNNERFITDELKRYEEDVLTAEERIFALEKELFEEVVGKVAERTKEVQDAAVKLAALDALCSLAEVAIENNYCRPVVNDGLAIRIEDSRHAVLETLEREFIPNSCELENYEMMIITGPNMAGKSTFMRQIALIVIMAQMGSFVPALTAEIGIVDRIFTRVGASDDLTRGRSTFMLEMSETANILNNATNRSLVILDEIGRGTSTFDGVSLAWSVAEYIYKKLKCKTMFATHYHVLNKLAESFENIKNFNIAVREDEDRIIFLRKIVPGGTDRSYGIHVAKLAGMPKEVIDRAREIQKKLEEEDKMVRRVKAKKDVKQLSLSELNGLDS